MYIVSYSPGYLSERLEVAALLWRHDISADVMYESSLLDGEHENHFELCHREGILCVSVCLFPTHSRNVRRFSVCPRTRAARRDQPAFRIKSILKGTECDGG